MYLMVHCEIFIASLVCTVSYVKLLRYGDVALALSILINKIIIIYYSYTAPLYSYQAQQLQEAASTETICLDNEKELRIAKWIIRFPEILYSAVIYMDCVIKWLNSTMRTTV